MIEKEHFYDDIDHLFNVIRCHYYRHVSKLYTAKIAKQINSTIPIVDSYLKMNYGRALAIISEYLNSNLFDYNYDRINAFFVRRGIERDTSYLKDLATYIREDLATNYNERDASIVASIIASPFYVTHTKTLIYRVKYIFDIDITKEDLSAVTGISFNEIKDDVWTVDGGEHYEYEWSQKCQYQ